MARILLKALCLALLSSSLYAAQLIMGDTAAAPNETFSFPIKTSASAYGDLYIGADAIGAGAFAIARLEAGTDRFVALVPEGASNLLNKKITHLTLTTGQICPVAVVDGDANRMHILTRANAGIEAIATPQLKGAAGAFADNIFGIGGGPNVAFAAVNNNGGGAAFGAVGSGIAYNLLATIEVDAERKLVFGQVGNAIPLDVSSAQVAIGGNLAAIGNVVAMHWSQELDRLYIALDVTAGGAGVIALLVGRLDGNVLVLESAAPAAAFNGLPLQDKIIGDVAAGTQILLNKIATMRTTTLLDYAIVAGEVVRFAGASLPRSVRALPLVNNPSQQAIHGTVADATQNLNIFYSAGFKVAATTPAQMPSSNDVTGPAVVGGSDLPGDVGEMFVQGDTVFVQVSENSDVAPTIYYSRALFDVQGKIRSWTNWQPAQMFFNAPNAAQQMGGFVVNNKSGLLTAMVGAVGNIKTVLRTEWSAGAANGYAQLAQELSGIMSARVFPLDRVRSVNVTPAAEPVPGLSNDLQLMLAGGIGAVSFVELARYAGIWVYNFDTFSVNKVSFTQGKVESVPAATTQLLTISGGALEELGEITALEITGNNQGLLFVGGQGGLAVLSDNAGNGWAPTLGAGFTELTAGMSFKKIGNYQYVRKIVYDYNGSPAQQTNPVLYVLTDNVLDRIDLAAGNPGLGQFVATRLADVSTFRGMNGEGALQDIIVSGKFAVMGTTTGLFRVGNGKNIATAINEADVDWTQVVIPEASGPVIKLLGVTVNQQDRALAQQPGAGAQVPGNLYVLTSYNGNDRACMNRFTLEDVSGANPVTSTTLQMLPDFFRVGIPSYFVSYGMYQNTIADDGSYHLSARSRNNIQQPSVLKLLASTRCGSILAAREGMTLPLSIEGYNVVADMMRNPATGSWFITGSFGLRANE